MQTFFCCVVPIVVAIMAYQRGKKVGGDDAYRGGYDAGYDAASRQWHKRMFECDRRHEARLQDIIAVATRPDARVILPKFPQPPCTNA